MSKKIDNITNNTPNIEPLKQEVKVYSEISAMGMDIKHLQKEVKLISSKIDTILDLLNMLSIFIEDQDDMLESSDDEEDFSSNEGWIPEINNWEKDYDPDDEDDE